MITFKSLNFKMDDTFNYNNLINEYEEYIDDNMGKFTCPFCSSSDMIKHSTYNRKFFHPENYDVITIKIQRLKCKHCGRTHAILIHFLVPYKRKTIYEIKQIINDHEEGNGVLVTEYSIVKTYKKWKQRLISINCLISSIWKKYVAFLMECADVFKMCFMQNKRRKYWCRGKEYEVIYAN